MTIKAFFLDALSSALELGIGTPNDVLRHVTPDVLATHLPRPLWARLITASLGAPRVDAQLIVETIGIANLCEHVPSSIIWACIAELGNRSLGIQSELSSAPASAAAHSSAAVHAPAAVLAPPPDERPAAPAPTPAPAPLGPSIPPLAAAASTESLADVINEIEHSDAGESRPATLRPRSPTAQRFRPSNTASTRLGASRRPQAAASASASASSASPLSSRRVQTEVEPEPEAHGSAGAGWSGSRDVAVDDSQLVDWQASDGNGASAINDDDFSDLGRKR